MKKQSQCKSVDVVFLIAFKYHEKKTNKTDKRTNRNFELTSNFALLVTKEEKEKKERTKKRKKNCISYKNHPDRLAFICSINHSVD